MGDRLISEEDISDTMCRCEGVSKQNAIEYQIRDPEVGRYKTVGYSHKDCPLHGIIRMTPRKNPPYFVGKQNE